jgi:hypothetical protein
VVAAPAHGRPGAPSGAVRGALIVTFLFQLAMAALLIRHTIL